jgi:phage repressor protein C with HTH and peptisase S24 domain
MKTKDVILEIISIKKRKVSQQEIGNALGVSKQYIGQIMDKELTPVQLQTIFDYFQIDFTKVKKDIDTVDIIYRPDVYLSAGYGADVYNEDKEFMTIDSRLLVSEHGNKINPANCEIVAISGNSMFPEYRHGDRVIIDKSDVELIDGHIFAFRYKNQCYVKEINLLGNKIKCISLNKEYDPFYISLDEEFTVFGRILPRIRL